MLVTFQLFECHSCQASLKRALTFIFFPHSIRILLHKLLYASPWEWLRPGDKPVQHSSACTTCMSHRGRDDCPPPHPTKNNCYRCLDGTFRAKSLGVWQKGLGMSLKISGLRSERNGLVLPHPPSAVE